MQRSFVILLLALLLSTVLARPEESKNRSRKRKQLSDVEHEVDGKHNVQYDHEAFLGKEESQKFDQLSAEESKDRLRKIVHKMDADGDAFITEGELRNWIDRVHKRSMEEDVNRQWKERETTGDDKIAWDEYVRAYYHGEEDALRNRTDYDFGKGLDNDRRRWRSADRDGDDSLTREEFTAFLFPYDSFHMRGVVAEETMADSDKDKDGFLNLEEYLDQLLSEEDHKKIKNGDVPGWVKNERKHFANTRDKDKDGKLNKDEVAEWVVPTDYDPLLSEAKHLIHHVDKDKNEKLTEAEILDQYDMFVGSKATGYGDVLNRHEEF